MSLGTANDMQQVVGLAVGGETYGISIARVKEIVRVQAVTHVPHAAPGIEGVTSLRGAVVPIMDLRRRCGVPVLPNTQQTRIVVSDLCGQTVGLIVDGVSEIHTIDPDAIAPPGTLMTDDDDLVAGIARVDGRLILLLNPDAVIGATPAGVPQ